MQGRLLTHMAQESAARMPADAEWPEVRAQLDKYEFALHKSCAHLHYLLAWQRSVPRNLLELVASQVQHLTTFFVAQLTRVLPAASQPDGSLPDWMPQYASFAMLAPFVRRHCCVEPGVIVYCDGAPASACIPQRAWTLKAGWWLRSFRHHRTVCMYTLACHAMVRTTALILPPLILLGPHFGHSNSQ